MPSQASSPDLPARHAWTHRPKLQGGTDPIEITAGTDVSPPIDLRNPTVNAGFSLAAFTHIAIGTWFYLPDVAASISGLVNVPASFEELAVKVALQSGSSGDVVFQVSTLSVGDGDDPNAALTDETAQTISVDDHITIARFPTTGSLASAPTAGDLLLVSLFHDGTDGDDTLAAPLNLLSAWLEVT